MRFNGGFQTFCLCRIIYFVHVYHKQHRGDVACFGSLGEGPGVAGTLGVHEGILPIGDSSLEWQNRHGRRASKGQDSSLDTRKSGALSLSGQS